MITKSLGFIRESFLVLISLEGLSTSFKTDQWRSFYLKHNYEGIRELQWKIPS